MAEKRFFKRKKKLQMKQNSMYQKIFSTPPEKPKTIIKSFNLKEENVKKLEEIAHAQNMSLSKVLNEILSNIVI